MKIGVLGGSFDPVHMGHLAIGDECVRSENLDELWFAPCMVSRYDKKLSTGMHRILMLNAALEDWGNAAFRVSMAEYDSNAEGRMYILAKYYQEHHPEHNFVYIVGSDSWEKIHTWYESKRLTDEFEFVIVDRPVNGTSSTAIRKTIAEGGMSDMLTVSTIDYIKENELYVRA